MTSILKLLVWPIACFAVQTAIAQTTSWVSVATNQVKLDTGLAQRIYAADINNDGYPDFVTVKGAASVDIADNLKVYINIQDPSSTDEHQRIFADMTASSGINAMPVSNATSYGSSVAALADINNDGNVDIVRGNYYGSSLSTFNDLGDRCEVLLGDGQGHFDIVAHNGLHELGLINPTGFSFLDYDKDGKIDLFIAVWFSDYSLDMWHSGYLMKGNGDGTFTDVSGPSGIGSKTEPMFGSCVVDWNNDGWPDIATAPYCRTSGQLWKNNGNGTFTDVAGSGNYNLKYMQGDNGQNLCMWGSMPEDYDNDGDMDFFFSLTHGGNDANEGHSTIVLNSGSGTGYHLDWALNKITRNNPKSSHHGDYDASWFDLDNDGLEDMVMTQGHYMPPTDRLYVFRQDQSHALADITQSIGLLTTEMQNTHQVEVLDYDLDGDDDILFCNNGPTRALRLIKNEIGQDNHWTAVRLMAPPGVNSNAIGARILVWAGGVQRMREVYAGRGNAAGQQPLALIFGLGNTTQIDSIQIRWPNNAGTTTTIRNPPVDQYLSATVNGIHVPLSGEKEGIRLKVYPNPAGDFILVQLSDNKAVSTLRVYNMTGQSMPGMKRDGKHMAGTLSYSISDLPPAQYILVVTDIDGQMYTHPFIKIKGEY